MAGTISGAGPRSGIGIVPQDGDCQRIAEVLVFEALGSLLRSAASRTVEWRGDKSTGVVRFDKDGEGISQIANPKVILSDFPFELSACLPVAASCLCSFACGHVDDGRCDGARVCRYQKHEVSHRFPGSSDHLRSAILLPTHATNERLFPCMRANVAFKMICFDELSLAKPTFFERRSGRYIHTQTWYNGSRSQVRPICTG